MAKEADVGSGFVPHFDVTTVDGRRVRYQDIWQRRNLILAVVAPQDGAQARLYASHLRARQRDFEDAEAVIVVTSDDVPGLAPPRVIVADRWGEILHAESFEPADAAQF